MSNTNNLDQIRYCERCGISFLWSTEEQKEARSQTQAKPTPPIHCPGCRILLPHAGRERGIVKWYNFRKRYGFLVRHDHPEIFVHGSDIQTGSALRPGDLVEFSVGQSERGLAAKEIIVLAHGEAPTPD